MCVFCFASYFRNISKKAENGELIEGSPHFRARVYTQFDNTLLTYRLTNRNFEKNNKYLLKYKLLDVH